MPDKKDIYYAQAYRYSHTYDSEHMTPTQQVIVKHDGILLIRELPDTVKLKEYDEIGIFLRSSHFLKNLEKHVQKAEAIIYGR